MSQITSMTSGGGGGGVASVTGGTGINITGTATNPVVNLTSPVAIANGGTNNTTYTTDGVIYYDGTKFASTAAGTAGQVLTSNGAGVAPTYQASTGGVTSITGNTGGAQTGAISIVTSNSVPLFAGAAGTITLNFALTDNLILGSPGSITTGNTNCGYGKLAAASISSGASNTFIGYEAGVSYTTGSNSTAVGGFALYQAVAGASNNTAIGYSSMSNMTGAGTGNTCLGLNSGTNYTNSESNNILIGSDELGTAAESNICRIGTAHLTSTYIGGIFGVTVVGNAVRCDSSGKLGTVISSAKYKENIADMGNESDILHKLRPVTFNFISDDTKHKQWGCIAEEVDIVCRDLVVYDVRKGHEDEGKPISVQYLDMIPMLLNEVQKLRKELDLLKEVR